MTTLNLTEIIGEGRPYELKKGKAAGTKLVGWRVKDDTGTTYEISTKPDNTVKLGPDEFTITPSGNDFPDKIKRVSQGGGGGRGRSPEETARIERQSARRDAIAYAAIVAQVENRVPSLQDVETWSRHFFDGVGLGGGQDGGRASVAPGSPPAAESSAATRGEKAATSRKLNDLGVPDPIKRDVVHAIAGDPPTSEGLKAINAAIDNCDYSVLFDQQGIERPPFLPDTRDLGSVA